MQSVRHRGSLIAGSFFAVAMLLASLAPFGSLLTSASASNWLLALGAMASLLAVFDWPAQWRRLDRVNAQALLSATFPAWLLTSLLVYILRIG
ncbi:MAG: hypothetical protein ACK2T2_08665, partial [Anaerolineales bacterium]